MLPDKIKLTLEEIADFKSRSGVVTHEKIVRMFGDPPADLDRAQTLKEFRESLSSSHPPLSEDQ
jgi:hypothetical protein